MLRRLRITSHSGIEGPRRPGARCDPKQPSEILFVFRPIRGRHRAARAGQRSALFLATLHLSHPRYHVFAQTARERYRFGGLFWRHDVDQIYAHRGVSLCGALTAQHPKPAAMEAISRRRRSSPLMDGLLLSRQPCRFVRFVQHCSRVATAGLPQPSHAVDVLRDTDEQRPLSANTAAAAHTALMLSARRSALPLDFRFETDCS